MRVLSLSCAVLVTSCASNPAPETSAPVPQTVQIKTAAGTSRLTIVPSGGPNVLKVAASIDRVWRALPAVYDSLSIPLTVFNARDRVIGNEGLKLRRRLGKVPLSTYLDCGRSQMDQNADEYEITMSVVTRAVAADSQQTTLTTVIEASGAGLQFGGQSASCTSKGVLEDRLRQLLQRALLWD